MKKITSLLALMLFFVFGATAQTTNRYEAVGFGSGGQLDELETGVQVALSPATATGASFLYGNTLSSVIDDNGVYEFEEGTAVNDTAIYYLKQVSTGKYVADPAYTSGVFTYTDSKLRAAQLVLSHPYVYESSALMDSAIKNQEPEFSYYTCTTDGVSGSESSCFKIVAKTSYTSAGFIPLRLVTQSVSTSPSWGNTYGSNTWMVYPVEKKSTYETLYEIYSEMFPNGEQSLAIFIAGEDPGQVDQTYIDELNAAFEEATDYINNENGTDEQYAASLARIQAAWTACENNVKAMREGYFYFSNWRTASTGGTAIADNAVFENTSTNKTEWTWTSGWTQPETPTAADAVYIYHIVDTGLNDSTFYIQNLYTGRYLGYQPNNNTKIQTTEQPEEKYHITIHPTQPGMFSVSSVSREQSSVVTQYNYPAMHAAGDYEAIVFWTKSADASAWYFREISEDEIAGVQDGLAQLKLNQALETLVTEAEALAKKGYSYSSNASKDSNYDDPGLVTESSQLWSNASDADEGKDIGYLLDSDFSTMWHSDWHGATLPGDAKYHNICADLGEAISCVSVKITKRMGTGAPSNYLYNAPGTVHFYATNDTTGFAAGDYSNWVDQGTVDFEYPYAAEKDGTTYNNETGINSCQFDGAYRYVRLDVITRLNSSDLSTYSSTQKFTNLSEIRFYEAQYDPSTSIIEAVPQEVKDALNTAIETAKDELIDEAATQETIDALQAAYDNYLANYPDPTELQEAIDEAQAQADAAEESDALGYFETGAKEELTNALAAIEVKEVMTVAEINEAKAAVDAALAVFNSKLNKPVDGTYYWIKSATSTESVVGNYVYAQDNGNNRVKWGGHSASAGDDTNIGARLNYIWKAVKNADGSYSFQNAATGTYIACQTTNATGMYMRQDADSTAMTLRSAKVAGLFNLVQTEGVYMNAEPGYNNVVTWGSASGNDNSAFQFVEAEWLQSYYVDVTSTNPKAVSLPFAISVMKEGVTFYSVLGVKDNEIQLAEIEENTVIPAGTPFIIIADEGTTGFNYYLDGDPALDAITYSFETSSQNGMTATLTGTDLTKGAGFLKDGKMLLSDGTNSADANSAFFTNALTETTETGAASIPMEGMPTVDASTATAVDAVSINTIANGKMYDLQGRRVLKAQKGLYIINGKKVYVK